MKVSLPCHYAYFIIPSDYFFNARYSVPFHVQVLLIFYREDPYIVTLRNAIIKCGYFFKCCRNIEEIHETFKKVNYDLVIIDSRRSVSNPKLKDALLSTSNNTQINTLYEPENICQ